MKQIPLGTTGLQVPAVALGCMRLTSLAPSAIPAYLDHALSLGINFFDHADIYGKGMCESLFAQGLAALHLPRESIILQSKCGIVPHQQYNQSYAYIIQAADGILKRLHTDYLDILLLHRPDALVQPEEVAKAFDELHTKGKVRFFGVSNHRPYQIALLQQTVQQPLCVNQMQFSLPFSGMIAEGIEANRLSDGAVDRSGGVLDYGRLHHITMQAWSPFQGRNGSFIDDNTGYPDLNWALGECAAHYQTTKTAVASAWILRHPAQMQVIAGTMQSQRLTEIAHGADIDLTREEWYRLYLAAGHSLP